MSSKNKKTPEKADRYNAGKVRLELLDTFAMGEIAKVMTKGAEKYEANNWRKGDSFMDCLGSLERHIAAFKRGEDYDPDLGTLHLANAGCNIMFLLNWSKYRTEFDDRIEVIEQPYYKVGYDIDDVLLDFVGGWRKHFELPEDWIAKSWHNKEFSVERFKSLDENFWLGLEPKIDPSHLYTPEVYITSRTGIAKEVTEQWLDNHGFPKVPVVYSDEKAEHCQEFELDLFFDDRLKHYFNISKTDTKVYLVNMPHNQSVTVSNRIHKVSDAIEFR